MSSDRKKGSGLEWFIRRGSVVRGPFSSARVRHFVLEDKLVLDDEVSADRHEWQPLGSVPEVIPLQMRSDNSDYVAEQDAERKDERARSIRAIVVTVLVIVGLTVSVSLLGPQKIEVQRDCTATPVPGVYLEGCRLEGIEMSGLDLAGAHLANTLLSGGNLSGSDLSDADLRYADLSGADLSYTRLASANLKGADLRRADLTNAVLDGADLSYADLGGARLGGSSFSATLLDNTIWADGRPCTKPADCPR
jgi:hypothetical protein